MRTRNVFFCCGLFAIALRAPSPSAERFPFAIPGLDASPSATDMSGLEGEPQGVRGPVRTEGGHFVDRDGRRLRLLGVNFSFGANFPAHGDAERVAAHLAKLGVNAVRHHHMDARDIWRSLPGGGRELDPAKLERLAYLIAQLSKRGVYSNLNLHVSRSAIAAEGIPDAEKLPSMNKYVLYLDERLQALLKDYARGLLGYMNPHTGRRLGDEPSIATVEITNENRFALAGTRPLDDLPERHRAAFAKRWNAWLREKYASTENLREAWGRGSEPLGAEIAAFGDFSRGPDPWLLSVRGGNRADLVIGQPGPSRDAAAAKVEIEAATGVIHELEFLRRGLSLERGKLYTVSFWIRSERPRTVYVDVSRDGDPWEPLGLREDIRANDGWQKVVLPFRPTETLEGKARWIFKLGDSDADVWIAAPSFRRGGELSGLPEDARLEDGTVPVPRRARAKPTEDDLRSFLEDVEKAFFADISRFLKAELGIRAPITGSQADWQSLSAFEPLDFVDAHAYWEHPSFPRRAWDARDWTIGNTPMVRRPGRDALTRLAWYRVWGKPYTVSEYNHPAPGDYQVECVPLLCAFAALQDWDGVYIYSYQHGSESWGVERIQSFFDINGNPAKLALLATGAMLFRRADVRPAEDRVAATADAARPSSAEPTWTRGLAVRHRVGTDLGSEALVRAIPPGGDLLLESDTGEVRWDARDPGKARFLVDAPRAKLALGFIAKDAIELRGVRLATGDVSRGFGCVALVSLDGEPLERSQRMLLTSIANAENTGMVWNEGRTSVGDRWGTSPPLVEMVPVEIALRRGASEGPGAWKAYPLDPAGARRDAIEAPSGPEGLRFRAIPDHRTVWYELAR
ncbi:MAG: hypothetical protein ACUVYA_11950 [Planctomycetota bacterium]